MKKFLILLSIMLLLPVTAVFAQEVDSWYYIDATDTWAKMSGPAHGVDLCARARCFAYERLDSACNCREWRIPVHIQASVAQWVDWSISGTTWKWYVRKPGNYAADCITATIASNQDVLVDYHDFGPLVYDTTGGKHSVVDTIPIWYGIDLDGADLPPKGDAKWIPAWRLNDPAEWDTLYDSYELHQGIPFKLWNYIHVEKCNSACNYYDDAFISLKLLCQKVWIDTCGCFRPGDPGQYTTWP